MPTWLLMWLCHFIHPSYGDKGFQWVPILENTYQILPSFAFFLFTNIIESTFTFNGRLYFRFYEIVFTTSFFGWFMCLFFWFVESFYIFWIWIIYKYIGLQISYFVYGSCFYFSIFYGPFEPCYKHSLLFYSRSICFVFYIRCEKNVYTL